AGMGPVPPAAPPPGLRVHLKQVGPLPPQRGGGRPPGRRPPPRPSGARLPESPPVSHLRPDAHGGSRESGGRGQRSEVRGQKSGIRGRNGSGLSTQHPALNTRSAGRGAIRGTGRLAGKGTDAFGD